MLVYRYEDRNHVGPFKHMGFNRRFAQLPTAQEEGLQWHVEHSASACIDVNALIAYFGSNNAKDLENKGYRIAKYNIDSNDVQVGTTQVVFNINKAVLQEYID